MTVGEVVVMLFGKLTAPMALASGWPPSSSCRYGLGTEMPHSHIGGTGADSWGRGCRRSYGICCSGLGRAG